MKNNSILFIRILHYPYNLLEIFAAFLSGNIAAYKYHISQNGILCKVLMPSTNAAKHFFALLIIKFIPQRPCLGVLSLKGCITLNFYRLNSGGEKFYNFCIQNDNALKAYTHE